MKDGEIRLFQTVPHACGYYADRLSQNVVLDPASPHLEQIYEPALRQGFRRAGDHLYQPRCTDCNACIAVRLPTAEFRPDRSQRRCWRNNQDLYLNLIPASSNEEHFTLYRRYISARHAGGGMDSPNLDDFSQFLYTSWSVSWFIEIRDSTHQLLASAVTDITGNGLSAVYTYFDPAMSARGLGTYAILSQIEVALSMKLDYLYLGYWIQGHPKMDYKIRFQPLEFLRKGKWERV